jgi:hypothetical protein
MKTETAIKIIQKEARFLGMHIVILMRDVQKNGRSQWSDRVVEAVRVIAND